jgi:hypothetical protein
MKVSRPRPNSMLLHCGRHCTGGESPRSRSTLQIRQLRSLRYVESIPDCRNALIAIRRSSACCITHRIFRIDLLCMDRSGEGRVRPLFPVIVIDLPFLVRR